MCIYSKELRSILSEYCPEIHIPTLEKLIELNVIDYTLMKVLVIRTNIEAYKKNGMGMIDAMWAVAEKMKCSYEYVRKCAYYYTDINIPGMEIQYRQQINVNKVYYRKKP